MTPSDVDDDPETSPCYRHPGRETALSCSSCERPICTDCAVQGAVGIKCAECAKKPRAARGSVPAAKLATGIAAGTFTAFVGGTVLAVLQVPFVGIVLAYLLGVAVGEVTRRASGGFRDPLLVRAAATAAFAGVLLLPLLDALGRGALGASLLFSALAAVLAAVGAANRAGG